MILEERYADHPELLEQYRRQTRKWAYDRIEQLTRPLPTEEVSDWACKNVRFDEPNIRDWFSLKGRHYLAEPLNLWRRSVSNDITDLIFCGATRSAKTRIFLAGLCYRIALDQCWALVTKPMKQGSGGTRNVAKVQFVPMLKASPATKAAAEMADRHDINYNQQIVNGSVISWEGTGSPKQLAGNPNDIVVQDECDGYVMKKHRSDSGGYEAVEAHPSILADERTKDAANPLRYKSCSPTVEDGVIWQWLMRSDCRRRFLPCPRCSPLRTGPASREFRDFQNLLDNKFFILGWNEQYSVLPNKLPDGRAIPVAYTKWDAKAKNSSGAWDYARVMESAHWECPHCGGPIYNHEKEWMDERGSWHWTKQGAPGIAGFQLSSLYVSHHETSVGVLAKKFLLAHSSGKSMKGFINNDLAEVHISQEHGRGTIELTSKPIAQADWTALMTVDLQKKWPYIWFVVRKWSSFKLQPPIQTPNGTPITPQMPAQIRTKLETLAGGDSGAWAAVAELLRLDNGTMETPMIDWLLAKQITGRNLFSLFKDRCLSNVVDFGKFIYNEMGLKMPRGGDSEAVAVGHCQSDDWSELREIFTQFEVGKHLINRSSAVLIDSGYREKNNSETLRKCYDTATQFGFYDPASKKLLSHRINQLVKPCPLDNWQPWKGYPITRRWNVDGIARPWHYNYADPFDGTSEADTCVIQVLEGAADLFWERLHALREKRTPNVWSVSGELRLFPKEKFSLGQYERHLNARYWDEDKQQVANRGSGGAGHRQWPDELNDCEKMQIALADSLGFFSYENEQEQK